MPFKETTAIRPNHGVSTRKLKPFFDSTTIVKQVLCHLNKQINSVKSLCSVKLSHMVTPYLRYREITQRFTDTIQMLNVRWRARSQNPVHECLIGCPRDLELFTSVVFFYGRLEYYLS